jgi:hypothetical protein
MSAKVKNVLVVVADCLRADRIPATFKQGFKGAIYSNAWACGSATIPAFASLYTGLLPHEHAHISRTCTPQGKYMPGFVPNHNYAFVTENPFSRWAGELIQADGAGADWLVDNVPPEPWVMFYHSMITHFPYGGQGREYRDAYKQCEPEALVAMSDLYQASVGKMLDTFTELQRILSPDVAILTSDHGEGFLEHGFFGHPAGRMFPTLLHVPLYVVDGERKYTYKAPFSMTNFPQLVKAQAELGKRTRAIPGEQCYSAGYRDLHPRVASIRSGQVLVHSRVTAAPVMFDLAEDPLALFPTRVGEEYPIMPKLKEVESSLLRVALGDNARPKLTADEEKTLQEHLERLGYV